MPNGRSGGFLLGREELLNVLDRIGGNPVVGQRFGSSERSPLTAEEFRLIVESGPESEILVEEQDHMYYIVWERGPEHPDTVREPAADDPLAG